MTITLTVVAWTLGPSAPGIAAVAVPSLAPTSTPDMVTDINGLTRNGVRPEEGAVMGGELYFVGKDASGWELWKTDGTAAGSSMVRNILVGGSSNPSLLTTVGDLLYFVAENTDDEDLWVTDGTTAGHGRSRTSTQRATTPSTS